MTIAAPPPRATLQTLHPAYFALVMATGIVAIAADLRGMRPVALALFWLNTLFYAALWTLLIARILKYPAAVAADLSDHGRAVGFFTVVAATCVIASSCIALFHETRTATILWTLGIVLGALLTYTIFTLLTVKEIKPTLERGINGGWLVAVVAMQSVSVVAGQLAPTFSRHQDQALFFALALWLGGGMLYIWMISLIFYRYTFFRFQPSDLAPPYWINMGAVAISTLAGTWLIDRAHAMPLLSDILPFIKGFTLLFWTTATWWIPMLITLGAWRHLYKRFPLRYDPLFWGAVFPLGMYTVATHRMAAALHLDFLDIIPRCFVFIALAAWTLTFLGLLKTLLTLPTNRPAP
ncbi:MAG TPA: tellurite resistance/C4-dicarboxylate transporter family protein [Phycisphaerae bacterium]|nr:tellurite resistance/C4-dicarboxylate transporter family protein [Phycisphaerae bacterium]